MTTASRPERHLPEPYVAYQRQTYFYYGTPSSKATCPLCIKPELDDVFRLHNIGFAFQTDFAGGLGSLQRPSPDQVREADHFSGYKALFEVAMDYPRCLGGGGALFDRPGADFFIAGG